jgi:hypothetical protein
MYVFSTITESTNSPRWICACLVPSLSRLLVPGDIIRLVVSVLALQRLIRYIYYWNLQFLNNIIDIETKDIFLSGMAWVTLASFDFPV